MLEGFSKLVSGNLGMNGIIIGVFLILFGLIIIVTIHYINKKKKE
jgi:uncharacterized membrane protein